MTMPRAATSDQNATVAAGFLGWMLDAFDFFLVVMTLTAIAKEFGKSDAAIALSITVTLAFRPVGAFIFGLLADRYGRKIPLMVDLVFYSVIEVLSGLAPNYTTFLILRALFGIGTGHWAELEGLPLSDGPDGADEHGLARHAGYVSHVSPAGLGLGTAGTRRPDGVLPGGRARGWCALRSLFRPAGPPAHHRAGARGSTARDPDLGIRTRHAARARRLRDAVLRAGCLGSDSGAHQRARAGRRAWLLTGLRLPVRRGDRESNPPRAGAVRRAYELRADHGALGGAGVHRVRSRGDVRPGAARSGVWSRGVGAQHAAPLLPQIAIGLLEPVFTRRIEHVH